MSDVTKKMAAALAAVNAYLQDEEAVSQQMMAATAPQPPQSDFSPWGLSGRQEMMSMRQLIQMRAFSRF